MTEDEIAVMERGGKCILQLRGVRPFFSDKYDITKHPNYKYLSDYDKKNTFDMEKHLRRRPALVKPDEPFDYYEISEADLRTPPMNRRIRKKQDKKITEAINGLIFIAERREQQRDRRLFRRFVKRCEALYEQQRKEELTQ